MKGRPEIRRNWTKKELLGVLTETLQKSFDKLSGKTIGVLFSGGIDSSLAALLANRVARKTILLAVAAPDSHDAFAATSSAEALGLDLTKIMLDPKVVWDTLPEVIEAIGTSNQMDVEIALPFFLGAKTAKTQELSLLVSGQGPDELFAGYARYVRIFEESGEEELENQLWNDVSITHETNIRRDIRAAAAHGIEVFFPYLNSSFVRIAMSVPASMKINPRESPKRKVVFRELALSLGLPRAIAITPKKATQYSSGSARTIREAIAKYSQEARGLGARKTRSLVQKVLDNLVKDAGIPDST
ncbi:MAG: asparagine synthase C-terminal domain-containing protein [Promethearchaeota archaeon]